MLNLPPPAPAHAIVRQAEADVVRALENYARRANTPAHQQQDWAHNEERRLQDAAEQRRRDQIAVMRKRQTTSQRY